MLKGKSSTSVVKFWMLQNPEGSGWISLMLSFSIPRDENIHPLWDKEGVMVLEFMKSWELFSCLKSENILSSYVKLLSYLLMSCHGEIKTNFHLRTDLSINPPVFFFFFLALILWGLEILSCQKMELNPEWLLVGVKISLFSASHSTLAVIHLIWT